MTTAQLAAVKIADKDKNEEIKSEKNFLMRIKEHIENDYECKTGEEVEAYRKR